MSFKINQLLNGIQALPSQDNWEALPENFRAKYRELELYMADPKNNTEERTVEIAKMDDDLCEDFSTFEIEEVDETENETIVETQHAAYPDIPTESTEQQTETENDMKKRSKTKKRPVNTRKPKVKENVNPIEMVKTDEDLVVQTITDGEIPVVEQTPEVPPVEQVNEPVEPVVEQVNTPPANPYMEFCGYAATQESISAKDLIRYNIPVGMWKENKAEFVIGNIKFTKTPASLIFNRWMVSKL